MTKNTWFAIIFFTFVIFVAGWKYWAWAIWKIYRLRNKEQVFNLLSKYRFIEITGPSGKGKSWLLMHCFKQLEGVKFTNAPTPQSLYTLNKQTLETHMIGKWAAPNKWFYFLDDIDTFQKWSQQEFGDKGYSALKEYFAHAGKLGGICIWTNNGLEPEHIFQTQKNKTWKVLTYLTFMDKSLLFVQANDSWYDILPTIIPIDNQEIQGFYDPHWNIPKTYQGNLLEYVLVEKLKAEEGAEILRVIKESGMATSEEEWMKNLKYDRNLLLQYLQARKKEEEIVRKKSARFKDIKENIQRYGLTDQKLTTADLERLAKEDKRKKKEKKTKFKEEVAEEGDLDQENQEPTEENSEKKTEPSKKMNKKVKKSQN